MVETTILGRHKHEYIIAVMRWARRLEATEVMIHYNDDVTLTCKDGVICNDYRPTPEELEVLGR